MFFHDLETERLQLRGVCGEDREFLFREFSDGEVTRFLFDAEPFAAIEEADELIGFYREPEPRSQHRWILCRKADGARVGTCGFHAWDRAQARAEIGYDLLPEWQHQGLMTEAMTAILAFAQDEMHISRLDAHIYEGNAPSRRLAERCGFTDSGETLTYTFRGTVYPHKLYIRCF